MENKRSSLLSKARSIIKNIISAMRGEADSHSPSRKTMLLGGDMGDGLEIGIDDKTSAVANIAKKQIGKALAAMKKSVNDFGWNDLSGNITTDVNTNIATKTVTSIESSSLNTTLGKLANSNKPIYLMVDKKVLGMVSAEGISDYTSLTGEIPIVIV